MASLEEVALEALEAWVHWKAWRHFCFLGINKGPWCALRGHEKGEGKFIRPSRHAQLFSQFDLSESQGGMWGLAMDEQSPPR